MTTQSRNGSAEELLSRVVQEVAQQSQTLGLHIKQHDDLNAPAQEQVQRSIQEAKAALEEASQDSFAAGALQLEAGRAEILEQFKIATEAIHREATSNLTRMEEQHRRQAEQLTAAIARDRAVCETLLETMRDAVAATQEQLAEERVRLREDYDRAIKNLTRLQEELQRNADEQRRTLYREYESALEASLAANRRQREEQSNEFEQLRSRTLAELSAELEGALEAGANANRTAMAEAANGLNVEHQRHTDAAIDGINTAWTKFSRILIGVSVTSAAAAAVAIVMSLI
ncbi:MAG: hypothetical protein OXE17_08375 [Chloroflexi bacterium]|nr:hypothetical protein [Chloroflexota bacterium]